MFVYSLVTSIETRIAFSATLVFSIKLIKSAVSLIKIQFLRFSNWLEETIDK